MDVSLFWLHLYNNKDRKIMNLSAAQLAILLLIYSDGFSLKELEDLYSNMTGGIPLSLQRLLDLGFITFDGQTPIITMEGIAFVGKIRNIK